eukprot:CAMPEP_0172423328 /NCGR_PEP_ID=MMETSP1064-20121228/15286_1 /TAXON_ID=202472 /ORGANISM="Aulacoseira subarctica , Strain CCAP 1002/5" /LENGTH=139 /DNA_ID=CAMNT_0013164645 /DNA_START=130 /DNA_END=552 /DNA_ORIENTATION=+
MGIAQSLSYSSSITYAEPADPNSSSSTTTSALSSAAIETNTISNPMPLMSKRAESFEEKLYRKCTTQPLVPIGCGVTTYFLVSGIRSFMNRDSARSQVMMRGRVAAQACTVLAFCFYAGFTNLNLGIQPNTKKTDSDKD